MLSFNWDAYISNYPDLKGFNKHRALEHYNKYGKQEGRTDQPDATINKVFKNTFSKMLYNSIICQHFTKGMDLKIEYPNLSVLMDFYNGSKTYTSTLEVTDSNVVDLLNNEPGCFQNILLNGTFYLEQVAIWIRKKIEKQKPKIVNLNPWHQRYSSNDDVFIHIHINSNHFEPFEYYDLALSKIPNFINGYISSDSIKNPICTKLMRKYNLKPLAIQDEISILQWASTCRWVVLSKSLFSWFIGVLAFDSTIYYPQRLGKNSKYSNIFVFKDWNCQHY